MMATGLPLPMNETCERLDIFDRCLGENAVAEVEDVPRPTSGTSEHVVGAFEHPIDRTQKECRVKVALDGAVVPDFVPRLVERDPPVGADDISPSLGHRVEQRGGAGAEVDDGDTR